MFGVRVGARRLMLDSSGGGGGKNGGYRVYGTGGNGLNFVNY